MPILRVPAVTRNPDLTDFVLQPALREAKAVIAESELIILSERDSLLVLTTHKMALSIGFQDLASLLLTIQATGRENLLACP